MMKVLLFVMLWFSSVVNADILLISQVYTTEIMDIEVISDRDKLTKINVGNCVGYRIDLKIRWKCDEFQTMTVLVYIRDDIKGNAIYRGVLETPNVPKWAVADEWDRIMTERNLYYVERRYGVN